MITIGDTIRILMSVAGTGYSYEGNQTVVATAANLSVLQKLVTNGQAQIISESHIGTVGSHGKVFSDTMVRPNDTTQYSFLDVIGVNIAVVGVTAHTDGNCKVEVAASIIDVTIKDADRVTIASVTGTTEANGDYFITKIDTTHFTIPVPFVHAFISGGTIARMFQMDMARVNGGSFLINHAKLKKNSTVTLNVQYDLYLFTTPPSAVLDNAQQPVLYSATGTLLGTFIPIAPTGGTGSGGTGSDSTHAFIPNINLEFQAEPNSKKGYCRLVMAASTGEIPVANTSMTLTIGVIQD